MIIGTNFLDLHVRAIRCMDGIFEMAQGAVHIIVRKKAHVDAAETEVSTPKASDNKTTEHDNSSLTRCPIKASQKGIIH